MNSQINSNDSQISRYQKHLDSLGKDLDPKTAAEIAVGGLFDEIGEVELKILKENNLTPKDFVIDVGCGSGRLAKQLSIFGLCNYLGTDVLGDLLEHAKDFSLSDQTWLFKKVNKIYIPANDNSADFVCFFSVFTHLLHEQTYLYLKEAKRVLKPCGKIIFSFLEFSVPSHWAVFEGNINSYENNHLNMFIDRHAISAWSTALGISIEKILSGDQPQIKQVSDERSSLGQSVAILSKQASS